MALGGLPVALGCVWGVGPGGFISQNDINQIILAQLSLLGERLDSMGKNYVNDLPKKTNDMSKVKIFSQ